MTTDLTHAAAAADTGGRSRADDRTTAPSAGDQTPAFSTQLREGTSAAHEHAETRQFVDALMSGNVPREAVVDLWAQYRWIYGALEAVSDQLSTDPVLGQFVIDDLRRVGTLDRDLETMTGEPWAEQHEPTPTTVAYCDRIRALVTELPNGFVAHHYTRYLGDLAGGQVIGRAIGQRDDFEGIELSFPVFPGIPNRPRFREHYRGLLDAVPWDANERARVVEEAQRAFDFNAGVFEDLGRRHLTEGAGQQILA